MNRSVKLLKPYIFIVLLSVISALLWNSFQNPGLSLVYQGQRLEDKNVISAMEARTFFERNEAIFVDARSRTEFAFERIPGAVNIPFNENRETRITLMEGLSRDQNIIVYCLDRDCDAALRVAGEMRFIGFKYVAVMPDGLHGWSEAGYPLEKNW